MPRTTNNELDALPGFFYYPKDAEGLEILSIEERKQLLHNQGLNQVVDHLDVNDPKQFTDLFNALDNRRIPTHRRPGTPFLGYGEVPVDLRVIIEL